MVINMIIEFLRLPIIFNKLAATYALIFIYHIFACLLLEIISTPPITINNQKLENNYYALQME